MRSRRLRGFLTLTVLTLLVLAFGVDPYSSHLSPAEAAARSCSDVLFLGARGSGQPGPGSPNWTPTDSNPYGLGGEIASLRASMLAQLPGRDVATVSLRYPARSTDLLKPSNRVVNLVKQKSPSSLAQAGALYTDNVKSFLDGINDGVDIGVNVLVNRAALCPNEQIVLAGYSQGAMAIHRILLRLDDPQHRAILGRVVAVGLVADGDRVPHTTTSIFGGAPRSDPGVSAWPRLTGDPKSDVPARVSELTANVCLPEDPVCDFDPLVSLLHFGTVSEIHGAYKGSIALADAAKFLATKTMRVPVPEFWTQTVDLTVGDPFSTQLTASVTEGAVLQWRVASSGHPLPDGLTLTSEGLLSGTAESPESLSPTVLVRAKVGAYTSPWVASTINFRVRDVGGGGSAGPVSAVSVGEYSSCALLKNGTVQCWGANYWGELGNDNAGVSSSTPVDVVGLSDVKAITTGGSSSCALTTAGAVKCWGAGTDMRSGDSWVDSALPIDVPGLSSGAIDVDASWSHYCAVTGTGRVKCWGGNLYGELGIGSTDTVFGPRRVVGLPDRALSVSAGYHSSCALLRSGEVWCWGLNDSGQLGDGTYQDRLTPVRVKGLAAGVRTLEADSIACAQVVSRAVKCWGTWAIGGVHPATPVAVPALASGVKSLTTSDRLRMCALTLDHAALCWGTNVYDQLGVGSTDDFVSDPLPVSVLGADQVKDISAGPYHTCAVIRGSGAVKCWGRGTYGVLGNGQSSDSATAVDVVGLTGG